MPEEALTSPALRHEIGSRHRANYPASIPNPCRASIWLKYTVNCFTPTAPALQSHIHDFRRNIVPAGKLTDGDVTETIVGAGRCSSMQADVAPHARFPTHHALRELGL